MQQENDNRRQAEGFIARNATQPKWQSVLQSLLDHYGEDLFKSWFMKINFHRTGENEATLVAAMGIVEQRIKEQYLRVIEGLLEKAAGRKIDVKVVTDKEFQNNTAIKVTPYQFEQEKPMHKIYQEKSLQDVTKDVPWWVN